MTTTSTSFYPVSFSNTGITILPATASGEVTLATGTTNGSKITSIFVSSTDTTARDIVISLSISATVYDLFTFSCPITAGLTNAIPCVNVLTHANALGCFPLDSNGQPYLYLAGTGSLLVA